MKANVVLVGTLVMVVGACAALLNMSSSVHKMDEGRVQNCVTPIHERTGAVCFKY